MVPTKASPATWTLRFKFHKKTTLLHVDPLQSFTSIKTELLRALQQTHFDGEISPGVLIPSNSSDVLLAQPNDIHDPAQGWKLLHFGQDIDEVDVTAGAGKQAQKKKKDRATYSEDCPAAAGLKDGAMIAFKFRSILNNDEDDETLGLEDENDDWDVILPSYDDAADTAT